jgi:hypothetical protein
MMKLIMKDSVKMELAKEYPRHGEMAFTQQLITLLKSQLVETYPAGTTLRAAQPKNHGCVKAEFIIEPNLPEAWRVGIFKQARTYPAWIRFANQNRIVQPDIEKDIRGMSIKLLEVEGEKLLDNEKGERTQDFILISHNVFPTKNTAEFYQLLEAFAASRLSLFWFFFNPFNPHIHTFKNLLASRQRHANPLEIRYWSTTPYLFGLKAVKYSAKPHLTQTSKIPRHPTDDYLKEAMKQQLTHQEVSFDFMIQFQTDPDQMPIEDASKAWDESISPFQKVATIKIPVQSFDSKEQMEFCENLSFTPWHSLPEHRPLGNINRARQEVYRTLSKFRRQRNHVPQKEPVGQESF